MSIAADVLDDSAMSTAATASAGKSFSYLYCAFRIYCTSRTRFGFTHILLVHFVPPAKSKECDAAGIGDIS